MAVAAAVLELLPFGGYDALPWMVAGRATRRLHLRADAQVTLDRAAATRLVRTAGVAGAGRSARVGALHAARTSGDVIDR